MSKLTSCINLSRLLPITKLSHNINAISSLVYNDDQVLDAFLQKADQPLEISKEKPYYICSEYNRDGDSYRIPGTDKYEPPCSDGRVPPSNLLELEKALNGIFHIYKKFYYGESAVLSVYCYLIDEDNPNKFVCAIMVRNAIDETKKSSGKWESTNLVTVDLKHDGGVRYEIISSANIYFNTELKVGKKTNLSMGGSITKKSEVIKSIEGVKVDIQFHVENIGKLVEEMEGNMRGEIENIYFGKSNEIVGLTRVNPDLEINQKNIHDILHGNIGQ